MTDNKKLWYVEISHFGTFLVANSEREAIDEGLALAKISPNRFFELKYDEKSPEQIFYSEVTSYQEASVPDYRLILENIADELNKSTKEKELLYAEVKNRQVFHQSGTRDFNYVIFMPANSKLEAENIAKKRLFRTEEKFFSDYYNENCPPPEYFRLECGITCLRKVEVPEYKITLEKLLQS